MELADILEPVLARKLEEQGLVIVAAAQLDALTAERDALAVSLQQRRDMLAASEKEVVAMELALDEIDAMVGVAPNCDHATTVEAVRAALQQCANVARHVSELEAEIARIDSARDNLPDFDWGRAAAMKVTVAAIGIPAEPGPNTATPSGQEKT